MTTLVNLTTEQERLLEEYDPAIKEAGLADKIKEIIDSNNSLTTAATALKAALALAAGDEVLHTAGLAVGSTTTHVAHNALDYLINGVGYKLAAEAAGVDPSGLTAVPANKFFCWRLEVGVNGTVDIVEVTGDEDAGYDSAALAIAAGKAEDATADHAILGYVAVGTDSEVTPGTTALTSIITVDNADTLFEKQAAAAA